MKSSPKLGIACLQLLRVLTTLSITLWSKVESREATKNLEVNKTELPNVFMINRVTISRSFNRLSSTIMIKLNEVITQLFIQSNARIPD